MKHLIRNGDVLEVLRQIPDNTFHGMLSDPPYGLSFMGKDWDRVIPGKEVWAECLRVLRPGAYVLVFGGTRTFHRLAVAMEDAGFEIRDVLSWMYGTGFPKSTDVSKELDKRAGAKREVSAGTPSQIDTTRITTALETFDSYAELATFESTSQNSEPGAPDSPVSRFHYSAKVSTKERNAGLEAFPVLSGGEATDREDPCWQVKHETTIVSFDDKFEAMSFAAGIHAKDPGAHVELWEVKSDGLESPRAGAGRGGGNRNPHPTLKPIALTEYLGRLLLPPGPSTLLVPFSGTGSEMIGALRAGWARVLGVEIDPTYIEIAEARIKHWCP